MIPDVFVPVQARVPRAAGYVKAKGVHDSTASWASPTSQLLTAWLACQRGILAEPLLQAPPICAIGDVVAIPAYYTKVFFPSSWSSMEIAPLREARGRLPNRKMSHLMARKPKSKPSGPSQRRRS